MVGLQGLLERIILYTSLHVWEVEKMGLHMKQALMMAFLYLFKKLLQTLRYFNQADFKILANILRGLLYARHGPGPFICINSFDPHLLVPL